LVVERTCFETLAELFARDVDKALLARARSMTPTQRIDWLEGIQAFAEEAKKARAREAQRAAQTPG
jgi:hypothetical protein